MLVVRAGLTILCGMACSRSEAPAVQQVIAADALIEHPFVAGFWLRVAALVGMYPSKNFVHLKSKTDSKRRHLTGIPLTLHTSK